MTILNQYEILESTTPIWWSIIEIVFIIIFIAFFIASISTTNASTVKPLIILIFVAFVTIIWSFIVYPIVHKEDVPTGRYQYECTIDDGASFTDIMNNYIVVEQRGDIWVLEDKNGKAD